MIKVDNFSYLDIINKCNVTFEKVIYYLRGKNGAGKSTFLDCLSGLNTKYEGTISGNESILYLNQNLYFDNRLKSKDFVVFVLRICGINDGMNFYLNFISKYKWGNELEKLMDKRVGMLSGGERAKLFFSTLCCADKEWYLFDEPFSGVDEDGIADMKDIILELYDNGKGIILTSHEKMPLDGLPITAIYKISNGTIIEDNS